MGQAEEQMARLRATPPSHAAEHRDPSILVSRRRSLRGIIFFLLVLVAAVIWWASKTHVDMVVRGQGKVVPANRTQIIQSLEGGIVKMLAVREGQTVAKGELLLQFHDVLLESSYRENLVQREILEARIARLRAEAEEQPSVAFPKELAETRPDLITKESSLFAARKEDERTNVEYMEKQIAIQREKLALYAPMFESGSMPPAQKVNLEGELAELEGRLNTHRSAYRREVLEQLDAEYSKLEALVESIKADKDRLSRSELRAPIDGVVNAIFIDTVGRVVQGGAPIMEIVPSGDTLLIEARIKPSDIAFIQKGQRAIIRFTAYDFSSYGSLDGEVSTLGVDTVTGQDKQSYYPVKLTTSSQSLGMDRATGRPLDLKPGMDAEIDIVTGQRSILDYLLKPVNRAWAKALRER